MARKKDVFQDKILPAALGLAKQTNWRDIGLGEIAAEAGLTLDELREEVSSKGEILSRFFRQIDIETLKSLKKDPVEGEAHDRLFDVIMRRLEVMMPYRESVANIVKDPAGSAGEAADLLFAVDRSITWLLEAAGIQYSGSKALIRRAGLASVMMRTIRVWINDDDPGLAKTMAALDGYLRDGATWLKRLDLPCGIAGALGSLARGFMKARREGSAPKDANGAAA